MNGRYGLVGWPLIASHSPRIHESAFAAAGLHGEYRLYPVPPDALGGFVHACRGGLLDGFQVTIPYKVAVMAHLDEIAADARMVGAVNTVVRAVVRAGVADSVLTGHNTDLAGFRAMLTRLGPPAACRAVVLGAGGAARAVVATLLAGGHGVSIVARRPDDARGWLQRPPAAAGPSDPPGLSVANPHGLSVAVVPWSPADIARASANAHLLVNATPLGTDGVTDPYPPQLALPPYVADLVAWPDETPLIRRARSEGVRGLGGATMLVAQAAAAFTLWTGQPAPVAAMAQAMGGLATDARAAATNERQA